VNKPFNGYWMNPAYRIPDNACACVEPGTKPDKTVPIKRYNVRSFITSLRNGSEIELRAAPVQIRGFAFDGGYGIKTVLFSADNSSTQPPLTRAVWSATVQKMREKYAAPVPTNQVEQIIDYLAANYGKK